MKNKGFLLLTEQERNKKLGAALHDKSEGSLTAGEIREILHALPSDNQYEILIYNRPDEFRRGVARMKGARKRLILGSAFQGLKSREGGAECGAQPGAVAITVSKKTSPEECSQLHILVPPKRRRKVTP